MKKKELTVFMILASIAILIWFGCNPFQTSDIGLQNNLNPLDSTDQVKATSAIYVTPTGKSTNGGTSFSDALDIKTALANASAGQTVYLQAGTYKIAYTAGAKNTITLSKAGTSSSPITIEGSGGQAIVDFQFPSGTYVQDSYGFYVTGSYYYFKNITITNAGYQGAYVTGSYNTFESCQFNNNRNTGLEINKGGNNTTVRNCIANNNFDPKKNGSMADGFGPKQTMGPGNKFYNCSADSNSDDGFDLYDSPQTVYIDGCQAYRSGKNDGNGVGFKLGGNYTKATHYVSNCVSSYNRDAGYHANNNPGPIYLTNCTGTGNGAGLIGQPEAFIIK